MKQTTFKDREVIQLLNNEFYFISFDGESKQDVFFNGQHFQFEPSGRSAGTHALAKALAEVNGVTTYPSFVIINPEFEIIFQHKAYLDGESLTQVLKTTHDHKADFD